jgi:hypothetical protein
MGLLASSDGDVDLRSALVVIDVVCSIWNEKGAPIYGIELRAQEAAVIGCCKKGESLFKSGVFPSQPGPFKRAAAFLILGRLYPFFVMSGANAPNNDRESQAWLARFMALTIPAVLSQTRVQVDSGWVVLKDWRGFPSPHYQLEFLAWLRWLDHCQQHEKKFQPAEWSQFSMERLARMVMAVALIVEACYYTTTNESRKDSIQSKVSGCLSNLEDDRLLDIIYTHNLAQ